MIELPPAASIPGTTEQLFHGLPAASLSESGPHAFIINQPGPARSRIIKTKQYP